MRNIGRHGDGGQAIIEFALVMPILALIIVGIFDLGSGVFANNMIENAARAGARAAVIKLNNDAAIRQHVRAVAPTLNLPDSQITISPSPTRTFDEPVTVTVTYTYKPITPFIGQILPSGIKLSAKSTMIVEGVIAIP